MLRKYRNDYALALAAYFAGTGEVDAWITRGSGLPGREVVEVLGTEAAVAYVDGVLALMDRAALTLTGAMLVHADEAMTRGTDLQRRLAHTVHPGEGLSGIAHRAGVSACEIVELNKLDPSALLPARRLLLLKPMDATDAMIIGIYKRERRLVLRAEGRTLRDFRVALGSSPRGDKEKEGDGRTLEGEFYVCQRLVDGNYGHSLGLSYPNLEGL